MPCSNPAARSPSSCSPELSSDGGCAHWRGGAPSGGGAAAAAGSAPLLLLLMWLLPPLLPLPTCILAAARCCAAAMAGGRPPPTPCAAGGAANAGCVQNAAAAMLARPCGCIGRPDDGCGEPGSAASPSPRPYPMLRPAELFIRAAAAAGMSGSA